VLHDQDTTMQEAPQHTNDNSSDVKVSA
jgi:hypothetical protein